MRRIELDRPNSSHVTLRRAPRPQSFGSSKPNFANSVLVRGELDRKKNRGWGGFDFKAIVQEV